MIESSKILSAVQARLTGDATLTSLIPSTSIGNHLDQDTPYPHLLYSIDMESLDIKGEDSIEANLEIQAWFQTKSDKKCMQVRDALFSALDNIPLTIASADCFGTVFLNAQTSLEQDGVVHTITANFKLLYGEN